MVACQGDILVFPVVDLTIVITGILSVVTIRPLTDVLLAVGFCTDGDITKGQIISNRKRRNRTGSHNGKYGCCGKDTECEWFTFHKNSSFFIPVKKDTVFCIGLQKTVFCRCTGRPLVTPDDQRVQLAAILQAL